MVVHIYFAENLNECESSPCKNGGTCNDSVDGYTCVCAEGYKGKTCEGKFQKLLSIASSYINCTAMKDCKRIRKQEKQLYLYFYA